MVILYDGYVSDKVQLLINTVGHEMTRVTRKQTSSGYMMELYMT